MNWIIYTRPNCKWCDHAKALLRNLGHSWTEIQVTKDTYEEFLNRCPGATTVPQILLGEKRIGGYQDLVTWTTGEAQASASTHMIPGSFQLP